MAARGRQGMGREETGGAGVSERSEREVEQGAAGGRDGDGTVPPETLREAYDVALETRAAIVTCMNLKTRGEGVEFWIGGPGEEVHGVATALALHRAVREEPATPGDLALFPHYRSDALAHMLTRRRGDEHFVRDYFRQALGKATDPNSGGRQMVMHLCRPELGIMPVQSPVGMQLGKAAGYARGLQLKGQPGVAVAVVGDGTTGESDFHEAAMAASVWRLPLIVIVTDNEVAISVKPEDGRGIRSYATYAEAFGMRPFECDGFDFRSTYEATLAAARLAFREQQPVLIHAHVPRLMGHSSSSGGQFDLDARDPLVEWGAQLADEGVIASADVFARGVVDRRKSYFEMHRLGQRMADALESVRATLSTVRREPDPSPEAGDLWRHVRPPFPRAQEPLPEPGRTTRVQVNEALNRALDRALAGGDAALWGQDVGERGGVFQVTAGLHARYPDRVRDTPLNEPLIVGTATGAALHQDLAILPEIQFGDYAFNALHWFVHLGNLYWSTNGQIAANVTVRMPVDPVQGGALYHSMSVDGYFGNIPGLVITTPSTAWDAYGLTRSAVAYRGPVLQLEPKRLYRMRLGPALPGEPQDPRELQALRRAGRPLPIVDYKVPLSRAAKRRAGRDVTVVAWGWAAWQAVAAADKLAADRGVEAEVWDLRTLVPYDREAIFDSARRTGKVLIAHADRTFAGFGRQIQGDLVEHLPGVVVRVVGQLNTPGVGSARVLEDAITLAEHDLVLALSELANERPQAWLDNELHWLQYAPSRALL